MKILQFNERIAFWCPGCGTLMQVCPKRWNWNGDVDRPTLSPSILQTIGPFPDGHKEVCHCFVRDGNIEFCGDCTHDKRGVMPLPELESVIEIQRDPDGNLVWTRKP
ncbi:MAG: hypothetical protein EHM42_11750 [Planctomycetaceae bacterium]|nr:MAG: hypothetical protein EHM42_11750 [Planctomycetaceae bacterium]